MEVISSPSGKGRNGVVDIIFLMKRCSRIDRTHVFHDYVAFTKKLEEPIFREALRLFFASRQKKSCVFAQVLTKTVANTLRPEVTLLNKLYLIASSLAMFNRKDEKWDQFLKKYTKEPAQLIESKSLRFISLLDEIIAYSWFSENVEWF